MEAHDGGGRPATMEIGPLGSTIHVLHADAGTIAELAHLDWNRAFSRVCLDPVRGLITLMTPSRLHEDLTDILTQILAAAASVAAGAAKSLKHTRLRVPGDPPGTGMEPDCAFYFGDRARAYRDALAEGEEAADAFLERNPPDLVVEAEITHGDEGKVGRYAELGVRELWRLHGRRGTRALRVEFLALQRGATPRALDASAMVGGLTPGDVCEAIDDVRLCVTPAECAEAVARIVNRRRRASVRVRDEAAAYAGPSARGALAGCACVARPRRTPAVPREAGVPGARPRSNAGPAARCAARPRLRASTPRDSAAAVQPDVRNDLT